MKFDRQAKHVIYVERDDIYRVTYDSVKRDTREPKPSDRYLVGISSAISFWDVVDKRKHCLACARTIKAAWDAGDRYLLDTDEARKAAELVTDLADTRPDDNDICSALSDLANHIASVRLSTTTVDDFEVLPACRDALEKCLTIPGYEGWTDFSKRRRFLYVLNRKYRTPVVHTIMSLYFRQGATPILTTRQRNDLLNMPRGEGFEGAVTYMDDCLRKITEIRFA